MSWSFSLRIRILALSRCLSLRFNKSYGVAEQHRGNGLPPLSNSSLVFGLIFSEWFLFAVLWPSTTSIGPSTAWLVVALGSHVYTSARVLFETNS